MKKKIVNLGILLLLITWFVMMAEFVTGKNDTILCKSIVITISDSATVNFVNSDIVREALYASGENLQGYPVKKIKTRKLESVLEKNPYISNVEVYTNIDGELFVDILQRKALIKVMPEGKEGYYIDCNGIILPLSEHYSPHILPVSGTIDLMKKKDAKGLKLVDIQNDSEVKDLLSLAHYIESNQFWKNQVVQLYRSRNGDFELVPRVGAHQVILGSIENYQEKLCNLEVLYKQGFKQSGWNNYNKINLKYSNQIICTKR